jgi:phosphoglycerate-specific signal transduction histidine kinase
MAELRQPLTAASNYIGAARTALGASGNSRADAIACILDKASEQILRAGEILNQLRGQLCDDVAGLPDGWR